MSSLGGKVALITGAANGIGKAIGPCYAKNGAKVAICEINEKTADATAAEIRAAGGKAIGVTMDVANAAAIDRGTDKVVQQFGGLDVLISNAGIQVINPIDKFTFADWQQMLAIHLNGGFLTTRAAVRQMYKNKHGGTVIYMGSVHSHEASVLKSAHVTAKHGLLRLARTLAKEGATHNLRSNVICPGFVRTPLVEKQIPEQAMELHISEGDVIKKVMLEGCRRWHLQHGRRHRADRAFCRNAPVQRADRPVGRRQPRLVHAVDPSSPDPSDPPWMAVPHTKRNGTATRGV